MGEVTGTVEKTADCFSPGAVESWVYPSGNGASLGPKLEETPSLGTMGGMAMKARKEIVLIWAHAQGHAESREDQDTGWVDSGCGGRAQRHPSITRQARTASPLAQAVSITHV